MLFKFVFLLTLLLLASTLQSCSHVEVNPAQINVKKLTYNALRRHDCRVNEPSAFCSRMYTNEYHEYEELRKQFIIRTAHYETDRYRLNLDTNTVANR
jgi:hypothetical protein